MNDLRPLTDYSCAQLQRAVAYGDGLFETMRVSCGRIPWLEHHWQRLAYGLRQLELDSRRLVAWKQALIDLARTEQSAVLKLTVFARGGLRGYARPGAQIESQIGTQIGAEIGAEVWAGYEWCALPEADPAHGIRVQSCQTPWLTLPKLSGIKHLNRLPQVLASNEFQRTGAAEGLLYTPEGFVVCATSANVFAVAADRLRIPDPKLGGVAGVAQARVVACAQKLGLEIELGHWTASTLMDATELFLSNAIRGVRPVAQLDQTVYPQRPGGMTEQLRQALWEDFGTDFHGT